MGSPQTHLGYSENPNHAMTPDSYRYIFHGPREKSLSIPPKKKEKCQPHSFVSSLEFEIKITSKHFRISIHSLMFLILLSLNAMSTTWTFYTSLFITFQEVQKLKLLFPNVSIYCPPFTHGHLRSGPSFPSSFANMSSLPKSATHVCIVQARTHF